MKLFKSLPGLLVVMIFILQSCSSNPGQQQQADSTSAVHSTEQVKSSKEFRDFLKKFKLLSLPLNIQTLSIVTDSSPKLNTKDNVFIKSEYPDEIYAYGLLPDTTDN